MGKNKKNNNSNANTNTNAETEEEKHEENSNVDEAVTDENHNDEKPNESKSEKNNKQNAGVIVLGVYLHCQGCVDTVVKSLRGFDGVEEIETNTKDNRVTVKGKSADAVRVAERVRRKSGKHVDIISPVQKKQPEKKPEKEKKPEAPKVIEVVLKIYLHCEGCAKDVKYCIHKMEGVQTVNTEMDKSLVTVKGTFDPKNLVAYIIKRTGKHAEIVNPKNNKNKKDGEQKDDNEKKEKNEKKDKEKDGKNAGSPYPNVPPGLIYAPQLFSDENPNACSIM